MKVTKKISHRQIEKHFVRYGSIDRITAMTLYKCPNLTAVISNLKKEGYEFECLEDINPTRWQVTLVPEKKLKERA